MKNYFLVVMLFFVGAYTITAQNNDTFKQDAERLVSITSESAFDVLVTSLKRIIPQDKLPEAEKEIKAKMPKLYQAMTQIYMEEFTHDEIKELIKFYETPVGRKMASKTSVLAQRAMIEGMKLAQELTPILQKYTN